MPTSPSGVGIFPLPIKQGSDLTITCTWLDDNGNPINLTGYAMKLAIRAFASSPVALLTLLSTATTGSRIAMGGTAGTFSLIFAHADTAAFSATGLPVPNVFGNGIQSFQLGVYDLQFTDPSGNVGFVLEGQVTVEPQVTQ